MSYRIHEVVSALSLREFADLCSLLDVKLPDTSVPTGETGERMIVKGRRIQVKFNVVKVERTPTELRVLVDVGGGRLRRCELNSNLSSRCVENVRGYCERVEAQAN
jgi:hypothetical protein